MGRGFRPKARVESSASEFAERKKRRRRFRSVYPYAFGAAARRFLTTAGETSSLKVWLRDPYSSTIQVTTTNIHTLT